MKLAQKMKMPPVKLASTRLGAGVGKGGATYPGGLDLTTPSLELQPGALRDCVNFEVSQSGGYARIAGYERLDGRQKPSSAGYTLVQVTAFTNLPVVGDPVAQAGSGATGEIAFVNNVADAYYMIVTMVAGVFNFTGAITSGATPIGTAISQTVLVTTLQHAQYMAAAADRYRADIGPVPGAGDVTGVVGMIFGGVDNTYAFRPNVGQTAVELYKATAAGWVLVPFFHTISFTAGSGAEPLDGATLTQGPVTATIMRAQPGSGTFGAGTLAGTLVINNIAGGNFAAGLATISGGASVTLVGAEAAITLAMGGRFQFEKGNFSGQLATRRIYGCDGVNKAFEFDGVTLAPITTGLTIDAPSNIAIHQNYLFLSYEGSILHSAPGSPFKWTTTDGAGEIATGDTVTDMRTLPGSTSTATLGVFMRSNTGFLYGTSPADFNFVLFNTGVGGLQYSGKTLFDSFIFDDLGVITLQTSLNFGNFLPATLTKNILPFVERERRNLCSSSLNRAKSQYRVWFNNGFGLWLTTVNRQYMGATLVYFPSPVFVSDDVTLADGGSTSIFGSNDGLGYVYEMDKGTSFDGGNIDAYITLAWDPIKSPRIDKRFRRGSIEMQGEGYAAISFGYQLGYGSTLIGQPANSNYASGFTGPSLWDSFIWDNFVWDGRTLMPTTVDMTGTAENVQVTISSTTNYISAFNVNSIIYHYSFRRQKRD